MKSILRGKIFLPAAAMVFFCLAAASCAESVVYESALVWRTDERGDFRMGVAPPQSIYEISPGVETAGVVGAVTVVWKSAGDVAVEVSADDGLHYAPATNGVPRTEGFVPGTTLRWRASLGEGASLEEVRVSYADSSGVVGSFGNPALSGFAFRREFFLRGLRGRTLENYQVKIRVGESSLAEGADFTVGATRPDFGDIRFVLPDAATVAPHYLEKITGEAPRRLAHFFVKVPQIPPEGLCLFVYYGKAGAGGASDPESVFDFFDDFSSSSPEEKWLLLRSPGGTAVRTASGLLVDAAKVIARGFQFRDGVIEYSATAETGYEARLIIRDPDPSSSADAEEIAYASGFAGAEHCLATGGLVRANVPSRLAPLSRHDYRVFAFGERLIFERWSRDFTAREAAVSYQDFGGPRQGHIGFETQGPGRGKSISRLHWLRVRKYARSADALGPEPAVDGRAAGQEEKVVSPVFANLALAENGDLVLLDEKSEGLFLPPQAQSSFPARILTPSWKGEGVSVDVSSDSFTEKNFRRDAESGVSYYAARGDFVAGTHPALRVNFKKKSKGPAPRLESATLNTAAGRIVLLAPNGGETLRPGEEHEVRWSAWDYDETYPAAIEFSSDGGRTYQTVAEAAPNTGKYLWRVPEGAATEAGVLRVCDGYDAGVCDASDSAFSITRNVV